MNDQVVVASGAPAVSRIAVAARGPFGGLPEALPPDRRVDWVTKYDTTQVTDEQIGERDEIVDSEVIGSINPGRGRWAGWRAACGDRVVRQARCWVRTSVSVS